MRKSHLLTLLVLVLVVAAENAAMAAQFLFTPRAVMTERFSDNIYLTNNDKKDDFITTPTVGFTVQMPGQTTGISLSYDVGYNFYAKNDENDGWQHNALGSFWHNFTRETRLNLNNSFLYTKDPLSNRDVVNEQGDVVAPGDFTARQGLNTYYRDYSTARLTHQFGPENSTYAQFIYGYLKNNSDQYQDSQEISPSVGMTYWWSTWAGIELDGDYLRGLYSGGQNAANTQDGTDQGDFNQVSGRARLNQRLSQRFGIFEQYRQIYRNYDGDQAGQAQAATGGQLNQDYMVYAPSVGVFYQFDPTLTASLGVGYFYQQVQNGNDQQGAFPTAEINKFWDYQRWSIRTRGAAGLASADFNAENQGFNRYALADITGRYNFTRQFYGEASFLYNYSDYVNSENDEVDHTIRPQVGLGYAVSRWMNVRLSYSYNKLIATNSSVNDYEENSVLLTVTLEPDQPWVLWD
ncbi:MAG: outer membrane beta-barrel protein [Deltaproteobacteria bacterium]|nr:outer membrane beta-barrel protein [Deltaproteobacteria bacterium]